LAKAGFFVTKNQINASQVGLSFLGYQIFSVTGPLVLLNEAVQVADIDVDLSVPRRRCKMDLISPVPLESLYFQALERLCAPIVTGIKPVQLF
jgi:hypothetical protein